MPHVLRRFQVSQLAVQGEESVLSEFFRILRTTGQAQGQTEDASLMLTNQAYEGVGVSPAGCDKVAIGFASCRRGAIHCHVQRRQLQRYKR